VVARLQLVDTGPRQLDLQEVCPRPDCGSKVVVLRRLHHRGPVDAVGRTGGVDIHAFAVVVVSIFVALPLRGVTRLGPLLVVVGLEVLLEVMDLDAIGFMCFLAVIPQNAVRRFLLELGLLCGVRTPAAEGALLVNKDQPWVPREHTAMLCL